MATMKVDNYTLGPHGRTAEDTYGKMAAKRQLVLDRARELAELTIPSLSPPEGYQDGDRLYVPYQDIGARCINNMTSRIVLTMLPPNRAPFRHEVPESLISSMQRQAEEAGQTDPQELKALRSKIDLALSKREQAAKNRMETTSIRMVLTEATKRLLVEGNVLYRHHELDLPQIHGLSTFVTKRNAKGQPLLTILEEEVSYADLEDDLKGVVDRHWALKGNQPKDPLEECIKVYSVCKKGGDWWYSWQEMCGEVVPGTQAKDPLNAPPFWPVWMIPMYGRDYGRAYADEYYSGLITAENLSKAIQEASIAAAMLLYFTKPGSRTRPKDLKGARNLDVLVGSAEDITTLKTDKGADLNVAADQLRVVEQRLGYAFLLNSAVQRDGERVTAEEIRLMARELDNAMGGVYAALAQTFQRIVVERFLFLLERTDKEFPALPTTAKIGIKIVTGIDALGRSYDDQVLDELVGEVAQVFGPEIVAKHISPEEYFRRKAAAKSINPDGLIRSSEEIAQEDQKAKMQQMMQQVAPGVAQEAAKGFAQQAQMQQEQQMAGPQDAAATS